MTKLTIEDLKKREIRYVCFRLQTYSEHGFPIMLNGPGAMSLATELKKHFEAQEDFGGWKNFARTWDVDDKSPLVAVRRSSSIYTDWNQTLIKEAKEMPVTPQTTKIIELPEGTKTKAPVRDSSGKFVSKAKVAEVSTESPEETSASSKKKGFWGSLK